MEEDIGDEALIPLSLKDHQTAFISQRRSLHVTDSVKAKSNRYPSDQALPIVLESQSTPTSNAGGRSNRNLMHLNSPREENMRDRYQKVMNFNEEVMVCEFEKAERMLKRAEKLIKKAKL